MNERGKFILNIVFMQFVVIIYTVSTVIAKFAAGAELFSFRFLLFYGLEIFGLGVYAILWQQVIKRNPLSVAYANRAMTLFWSMIWAVVIFRDRITVPNICGVLLVMAGTFLINTEPAPGSSKTKEEESHES
ncbi:MAG: transporter [Lachnospiraceae bacterium]|nr:transporter [Lachnospiraceae bacterium]